MRARLPRSFFDRPAATVAPELLGRMLVRVLLDGTRLSGSIVETEAYEPGDPASHGFRGPTPRTASMFGPPGRAFVYFTYGNHWMMNAVTRATGEGSAVLIRALEPQEGLERMAEHRGRETPVELCSGPGKLAQALAVDGTLDGADLTGGSDVWLEAGTPVGPASVLSGPRVGVSLGIDRPWRFVVADSVWVSRRRPGPPSRRAARPQPTR